MAVIEGLLGSINEEEHTGKMLTTLTSMLDAMPRRTEAYGALINTQYIRPFLASRSAASKPLSFRRYPALTLQGVLTDV